MCVSVVFSVYFFLFFMSSSSLTRRWWQLSSGRNISSNSSIGGEEHIHLVVVHCSWCWRWCCCCGCRLFVHGYYLFTRRVYTTTRNKNNRRSSNWCRNNAYMPHNCSLNYINSLATLEFISLCFIPFTKSHIVAYFSTYPLLITVYMLSISRDHRAATAAAVAQAQTLFNENLFLRWKSILFFHFILFLFYFFILQCHHHRYLMPFTCYVILAIIIPSQYPHRHSTQSVRWNNMAAAPSSTAAGGLNF